MKVGCMQPYRLIISFFKTTVFLEIYIQNRTPSPLMLLYSSKRLAGASIYLYDPARLSNYVEKHNLKFEQFHEC